MMTDEEKKAAVYQSLREKYNLGDYSPEKRAELAASADSSNPSWNPRAALAGLGAAIAGRDPTASAQSVIDNANRKEKAKLDAFDQGRKTRMEDFAFDRDITKAEREDDLAGRERDVASSESQLAQALAKKMMPAKDFSGMSAADINRMLPSLTKIYDVEQKKLDRGEARAQRAHERQIKSDERDFKLATPYGSANTEDDAKKLKEAHESKMNFDSKIKEMIDLRKTKGTEYFDREAVARGKQLSKDLLLEYKNMAKLGVLSAADEAIINAIIPADPLAQDWAPGQDPILHKLEKFKEDSDRDFQTRIQTRTRGGRPQPVGGNQVSDGMVRVQAPDGQVRRIPADKLEAALKAGGKRVE